MRKAIVISLVLVLLGAGAALAEDNQPQTTDQYQQGYGSGYQGMGPGMMGPGYGGGYMMGPGMMGQGYGGYGMGPGMMYGWGHGRGRGYGMGAGARGWRNLSPKDQQKWQDMRTRFMQESLPLRQALATKQMELQTLWSMPNPDQARVNQLSDEVADLQAKLAKQHNRFLGQCRQQFGDRGWSCPGAGW